MGLREKGIQSDSGGHWSPITFTVKAKVFTVVSKVFCGLSFPLPLWPHNFLMLFMATSFLLLLGRTHSCSCLRALTLAIFSAKAILPCLIQVFVQMEANRPWASLLKVATVLPLCPLTFCTPYLPSPAFFLFLKIILYIITCHVSSSMIRNNLVMLHLLSLSLLLPCRM